MVTRQWIFLVIKIRMFQPIFSPRTLSSNFTFLPIPHPFPHPLFHFFPPLFISPSPPVYSLHPFLLPYYRPHYRPWHSAVTPAVTPLPYPGLPLPVVVVVAKVKKRKCNKKYIWSLKRNEQMFFFLFLGIFICTVWAGVHSFTSSLQ